MMTKLEPCIPEWFSGKNVFLTGATGFLGKALIEKLLRNCPKIGNIYILVRPKRGKQLNERVATLVSDQLYERVKREQPSLKMEEKLIALAGDVTKLNLGLSSKDRQILVENVHVIFHVAASIRFDDPLTDAVIMNVRGTREVCQLALDTKKLQVHIHVSTAFANCDRTEAKEVLYPQKLDWRKMIEIAENFDKDTLTALTGRFLDGMPNTYCFTKHIAEHVANDMMTDKKPCKIFRPSIVVSTMREEPFTGWIDNFNGPTGILLAYGKGIMRTSYNSSEYKPDYIPIDVVTKALVVSTWDLAIRKSTTPEILHCTCHNVADWLRPSGETLSSVALEMSRKYPLNDIMWIPSSHITTSTVVWYFRTIMFMLLPALIVDGLLKMMGKKPMLTRIQKKIFVAQLALRHFMINEWIYHNDNLLALQGCIKEEDRADWDYDFKEFDYKVYVKQCILGCRRYLLKESDDTLPKARAHYKRMMYLHQMVQIMAVVLTVWVVFNIGVVNYGIQKISNNF